MSADRRVAIARLPRATYDATEIAEGVRSLARWMGWDRVSTLGALVPEGARVIIKPNFVTHANHGPWGIEPLLTHALLVRAIVDAVLETRAAEVVVGDAPLQACNFAVLLEQTGLGDWAAARMAGDSRFLGVRDYRRTQASFDGGLRVEREGVIPLDRFVRYDLAGDSLLEPVSREGQFRVTQYPPAEMARTHGPGRHQYLVARDVIDADVVINLPKLKTHKKAGVTCALKNLIGINGNKEFLPHHRIGGSSSGGDCYPGDDNVKRALEIAYDHANATRSIPVRRALGFAQRALHKVLHLKGDEMGVEGSWSGNDTIWRTCLDLNRILLYGGVDGTLMSTPQRRVVHVVDAVVAGQGDGPLNAEPLPMGLLLAGNNAAAVDLVGASLLGYDPLRIPIVAHAFDRFTWPLTAFRPEEVTVSGDLGDGPALSLARERAPNKAAHFPVGWLDAVANGHVAGATTR